MTISIFRKIDKPYLYLEYTVTQYTCTTVYRLTPHSQLSDNKQLGMEVLSVMKFLFLTLGRTGNLSF